MSLRTAGNVVAAGLAAWLGFVAWAPDPPAASVPALASPSDRDSAPIATLVQFPRQPELVAPTATQPAPASSLAPSAIPVAAAPEFPYAYFGRNGSGGIVLSGRGRVATVQGPGPLDDEYVVEAVMEHRLLLRHVPSGVGRFVELVARRAPAEPPSAPEDSAQD